MNPATGLIVGTTTGGEDVTVKPRPTYAAGTLFVLHEPAPSETPWKLRVVHYFVGSVNSPNSPIDGYSPTAAPTLFNGTYYGGTEGSGIYAYTP